MKYLCLVYYDEKKSDVMSKREWDELVEECLEYGDSIRNSGHFLGGEALERVESATTVRLASGKLSVTDGPFAETKEQLAGFYLIDARDLNEAIQVASKIPPVRMGSIEIRPIRHFRGDRD